MRFFITEEERKRTGNTDFIEFQKGKYDGECWHIDSICMNEDMFYELRLRRLFSTVLPQFDYYGITQVSGSEFRQLLDVAAGFGENSDVPACLNELKEWIGDFRDEDVLFTICGI